MPSARTDCPSTASRGDGQQTRHESGQPCRLPQETHDTPSTPARRTRRPPPLCRQLARPDRTDRASQKPRGHPEEKRGRKRKKIGRKNEDLRPLACRIAAQVIKASNPAQSQPDRSQRRRPAGTPPATVPNSSPVSFFCPLSILLLESLQNPGPFSPVSRRTTAPRPPAWTPPAPGEPSHFRARPVSHETAQYLYSITYTPYPHFSLGNNLDDSPTVNELNPYLQNHIFSLTASVFLSTLYNLPRLQSYSSPIATKKTNIMIDFRPQIW